MSVLATLARPYAEAVFKRSKETDSSTQWSDTLAFLAAVMEDERLSQAAGNPKVESKELLALLLNICEGHIAAEIADDGENFVKLLVENNRLMLAASIKELFEHYKAEDEGYVDVNVKTAFLLSDKEQTQLAASLQKTLNKNVHLHMEEDETLIGGVLIRAGDKVIDGSIRGQLQQLAKRLNS